MPSINPKTHWKIPKKGPSIAIAVVVFLVSMVVAFIRMERRQVDAAGQAFPKPPAMPIVTPQHKPAAAPAASGGSSEFDKLMALLTETEKHPLAAKFAKEFSKEPPLRELLEDFKKDQSSPNPLGNLQAFARELTSRPEFKKLLMKFDQEPGFRQMAAPFFNSPQLRPVIREQVAALQAARARRARSTLVSSTSRRDATPPLSPSAASAMSASQPNDPRRAALPGRTPEGARALSEDRAGAPPTSAQPTQDTYAVRPDLEDVTPAGDDKDAAAAFASLCYRKDPIITREQCAAIEGYLGRYGLWEACVKANLFETCRSVCVQRPELRCGETPDFYELCLAAGESDCTARCAAMVGCIPPSDNTEVAGGGTTGGTTGGSTGGDDPSAPARVELSESRCKLLAAEGYYWYKAAGACCRYDGDNPPGCPSSTPTTSPFGTKDECLRRAGTRGSGSGTWYWQAPDGPCCNTSGGGSSACKPPSRASAQVQCERLIATGEYFWHGASGNCCRYEGPNPSGCPSSAPTSTRARSGATRERNRSTGSGGGAW